MCRGVHELTALGALQAHCSRAQKAFPAISRRSPSLVLAISALDQLMSEVYYLECLDSFIANPITHQGSALAVQSFLKFSSLSDAAMIA